MPEFWDCQPVQMQAHLLRLFSGGYNTLYDTATSWIEPTDGALLDALDSFDELGLDVSEDFFLEMFNAWIMSICDTATALGHTIPDTVRLEVRPNYGGYGLDKNSNLPKTITELMGWRDDSREAQVWPDILKRTFMDSAQGSEKPGSSWRRL